MPRKQIKVPHKTHPVSSAKSPVEGLSHPRKSRNQSGPLVTVLIIGVVMAGIAVILISHSQRQAREQRLIQMAVAELHEAGAASLRQIGDICRRVQSLHVRAEPLRDRIAEDLGSLRASRPQTGSPTRSTPRVTGDSEPDTDLTVDREAAQQDPDLPTREQVEARRRAVAARSTPPAQAARSDHRGQDGRDALQDMDITFREASSRLETHAAMAIEIQSIAERDLTALRRELRLEQARKWAMGLGTQRATAEAMETGSREALERLETLADQARALREAHGQAEQERHRQADAERLAREQAETEEREQARVVTYRRQIDVLIGEKRYYEALEQAERQLAELRTDAARKTHQLAVDQSRELAGLMTFLIESISANPMPWGWTQASPTRDIVGADREHLHVRGIKVAWSDVSDAQMARLIDHYLGDVQTQAARYLRHGVGAALFFYKAGMRDQAQIYVERAVALQPRLREQASRLLSR